MANGAYPYLQARGIELTKDMEIVGYGDTVTNELLKPAMTVIDLPVENMVIRCIELVLKMMKGQEEGPITVFEQTYFIFRDSCGDFSTKWK